MWKLPFTASVVLLPVVLSASHNRAGEITYALVSGTTSTYVFTVNIYNDCNAGVHPDQLYLDIRYCNTGQNVASLLITLINGPQGNPLGQGICKRSLVSQPYTFPGAGWYTAGMADPMRIGGVANMTNSANIEFYLEDSIFILNSPLTPNNNSPILLENAIGYAHCCSIFTYNPTAYDPDGDSLVYSLEASLAGPDQTITSYSFPDAHVNSDCPSPNILSIDPHTGTLTWNVAQDEGTYNLVIRIREFRDGLLIGTQIRDMQIIVSCGPNNPPELTDVHDTCVIAGEHLSLSVSATDLDGDVVVITAQGGPLLVSSSPAVVNSVSGNPATLTFDWQTVCDHVAPQPYSVVFKAQDTGGLSYADFEVWIIHVVAPPPTGLAATANGNAVDLTWDNPYACFTSVKFKGFSVWRKVGCDSVTLDTCFAGSPDVLGYENISGRISGHGYTDNSVVHGLIYSYRVVAEFGETSPAGLPYTYNDTWSLPSNEACIELKKDVPIITHVDVLTTDATNGQIEIRWVKPFADELDTVQNHGPYKYELLRDSGAMGSSTSGTIIQTFTSPTFAGLNQTSFIDLPGNTQTSQWNYAIRFFATDNGGQFYEVGTSDEASSVFLAIQVGGGLKLNWNEEVPWVNYAYAVLKETPTGSSNFVPVDTVAVQTFSDQNVTIGELYCYKIRSIGSYFNPAILPDSLINHSQIACAIPIDTVPPCAPVLTVANACDYPETLDLENLRNILSWNNPNNSCADDVAAYNVYWSSKSGSSLVLIGSLPMPSDTVFIHDHLPVLAGCYAVTAVDSSGNESPFSSVICVDNCPRYVLPNVFTPNGDGANEHLIPFPYVFIDHIDLKVYSRWGNLVFQTSNPDIGWNGSDQFSGKTLREGTYYYVCDVYEMRLDGVYPLEQPLSGYIHLIR